VFAVTDKPTTLQAALVTALAEMPNPVKNADNPAFKRDGKPLRYADLEATLDACRPILAANGIALLQMPVNGDGGIGVHTLLIGHGEQMDCGTFTLPMEGQTPQKAAGAITYARRYALTALFGLAQEDDDANAASATKAHAAESPASNLASEGQRKAMWGKAKELGLTAERLGAGIAVYTQGRADHPDTVTASDARTVLDSLQGLIDARKAKAEAPVTTTEEALAAQADDAPIVIGDDEIAF
jgi:hypothetical protein